MKTSAPTASAARSTSAREASGRPKAMFSAIGAPEEEPFLRNDPELAANRRLRDLAQIGAVDRDAPVSRVVEAGEQLRDRRLPGARVADERDRGACGHVEVEVVQHVGELAVAEADVLEADVALGSVAACARPASRRCQASRRGRR